MYKIVFSKTGDYINIVVENKELLEYWLSELKRTNKDIFKLQSSTFSDNTELSKNVITVNSILSKFKIEPFPDSTNNWLDQSELNRLHEQWVKMQHLYPNIVNLLRKIPKGLENFNRINTLIHKIEKKVEIEYINDTELVWQTKNIFGPGIAKLGMWNIQISHQNLGRTTFSKWQNYDDNVVDQDTNNYTHLGGLIQINLARPYTVNFPIEYLKWCEKFKITPYGQLLPIGNFDLDITTSRILFHKNVGIENNTISFEV